METLSLRSEIGRRIVKQILDRPDAYLIIGAVTRILDKEHERRIQFYNELTERQKAEFINGQIVMHSPVNKSHNEVTGLLYQLLNVYTRKHDLGFVGVDKVMVALSRNDYEPDICYFRSEKSRHFKDNQTLFPIPDFVVEVSSSSSEPRDRGVKFNDYLAHGVEEYWIIDPENHVLKQYLLDDGKYKLVLKATKGYVKSFAIGGFEIPIEAIFDGKINLETIQNL